MSATLSIRVDSETEEELATLTADGRSRNAAIVSAIHEAYRQAAYARLREDADALRTNPEYQAEVQAARADMGAEDAW